MLTLDSSCGVDVASVAVEGGKICNHYRPLHADAF